MIKLINKPLKHLYSHWNVDYQQMSSPGVSYMSNFPSVFDQVGDPILLQAALPCFNQAALPALSTQPPICLCWLGL